MARLLPHITTCSNFSPRQSAYRPSHSCETMLLGLTNDLFTSIGNRRAQCLCTIDLSVAFDTVDDQILSERLKTDFGIGGEVALWLRSYFTNRSQIVRISSAAADRTPMHMGVPQGSVLGHLLFTAYMSPISRIIERYGIRQHHYADDTTLYADVTDARNLPPPALTQCCEHLTAWCYANGMQLNPDKSEVILFYSPSQLKTFDLTRPVVIAGTSVQFQRSVKIVGVTLDYSETKTVNFRTFSVPISYNLLCNNYKAFWLFCLTRLQSRGVDIIIFTFSECSYNVHKSDM